MLRRHLKCNTSKSEHLAATKPSAMLPKPETRELSLMYSSSLPNAYFPYGNVLYVGTRPTCELFTTAASVTINYLACGRDLLKNNYGIHY